MNTPQKTHYADDETPEYIAGLEQALAECRSVMEDGTGPDHIEGWNALSEPLCVPDFVSLMRDKLRARCCALELSARKSAEQLEEARAALRYYADKQTYETSRELCNYGYRPIEDDRGEIARAVLGESKNG